MRRLSVRVDPSGTVLSASPSPASLFGFDPTGLAGQSVGTFIDVFEGLPERGAKDGADLEQVLETLGRRWVCVCGGAGASDLVIAEMFL
jgi:hypothetical protein